MCYIIITEREHNTNTKEDKTMKNRNQEVADRLASMNLSQRAQDVIHNTDLNVLADLFEDMKTEEDVEAYVAENYPSTEAVELAERIRKADEWNSEDLAELCEMAGLEREWQEADGETFEQVAYKAAEILGVEI